MNEPNDQHEPDPYELHLLRERHRRALRRPWTLMFAGGLTVCGMLLWEMLATGGPVLNAYVLLLLVTIAVAGAAWAFEVRGKWPAAVVLVGSLPHTLGVLSWLGTDGISRPRDLLFLGGFALLPLTAVVVLLLPRPETAPIPGVYENQ